MNDNDTTTSGPALIVVGASGRIGREVARLGVAYGASVVGVTEDGLAPTDEPWVHGVRWLARDATMPNALADLDACPIVVAAPIAVPLESLARFPRVVLVAAGPLVQTVDHAIVVTPGEVDDSPLDTFEALADSAAIRIEIVTMAILRAALDNGLPQQLGRDEIAFWGDAVMWQ